jgi:UDP:flavonoid glycosyltransferase YjiC (YdhE family)/SAM-dependent methyltransferase
MRFLFCTRPFYGHLYPMAPVARALQAQGHEVVFATAEAFRPAVESAGFAFLPAGGDPRAPLPSEVTAAGGGGRDWGGYMTRTKTDDLVRAAGSWSPDVVVREQTDFAGLLASEVLEVPCATTGPAMYIPRRSWRRLMGGKLDLIRRDYGTAPDPGLNRLHPYLFLDVAPPWYQLPEVAELSVAHPVRPVPFCPLPDQPEPPFLAGLPARPTVYVTLGTVFNRRPALFAAILDGLADLDVNVVATTGVDQDPAEVCAHPPANVHIERWIHQSLLLPHCSAVIAHGGFTTVMGALSHGLPMLLIPLGSDNAVHARRCGALGVGLSLVPNAVDAATIRRLAGDLLHDRAMRREAERRALDLHQLPSPETAAALLGRLGTDRRPVPAAPPALRGPSARHPGRTAVVIPVYGRIELTHALIADVAREPGVDPVVVDNGGDYRRLGGERVLRPGRNLGWAGGCNYALTTLRDVPYDSFALLNNDTRLSADFFGNLRRAWRQTGAALLGPGYDGIWPYQQVDFGGGVADYVPRPAHRDVPFLDGTCLFLPRTTLDEVGLLDTESFPRHGWGVDFDYALRVRGAGGQVQLTELAYLHHERNGTAGLQDEGWRTEAWDEMVAGMRRKWGQAWPHLLRAAGERGDAPVGRSGHPGPGPGVPCVFVVGAPAGGSALAARVVNLAGVPPQPADVERRLRGFGRDVAASAGASLYYAPRDPGEVLRAAPVVAALDAARASFGSLATGRPWMWYDAAHHLMLPFWSAALDVQPVVVLVLDDPAEVAAMVAARARCGPRHGLAVWERSLRHALRNLVGLPVLVTRYGDMVEAPTRWADRTGAFLQAHGVPMLAPHGKDAVESVARRSRDRLPAPGIALSAAQRSLAELAGGLLGAHDRFPDATLPVETPDTERLLRRFAPTPSRRDEAVRHPSRLAPEWVDWVEENRRLGVSDDVLLGVLAGRGLPYQEAQRELDLVAGTGGHAVFVGIPWSQVRRVLCLKVDGSRTAPLFDRLGLEVTVADLPDLPALYGRDFDLVYHPASTPPVPSLNRLYRQVARVLRPGGRYAVEHRNPLRSQLAGPGGWTGAGYRIVRPHPTGLAGLLGTLCDSGFVIEACTERAHGDATATAGTGPHLDAFIPPFLAVLARLVSR